MKAGEEFNIKPTGPSDIRRIEGAIFNWGADMTYENNPIEMGLDRLVDWDSLSDDRCISLAALKRIRDAGVGRTIVGVEMDGEPFEALNNVKWPVTADGAEIGKVTSAIYSPRLEKNIGYAWVPTQYANHGHVAGRRQRMGRAQRRRRGDAVRGPEEGDPGRLSPSVDRCAGRAVRRAALPGHAFSVPSLFSGIGICAPASLNHDSARSPGIGPARRGGTMANERQEMLEKSATLYFGPWYRKSPMFEATRRAGCTAYDIYNHMYLPGYYDDPEVEYFALNNDVTLWDVGVERTVEVSGPDADALIDSITCRDLTKCAVGQGKYMLVTAPDGSIVNDPVLLHIEAGQVVDAARRLRRRPVRAGRARQLRPRRRR